MFDGISEACTPNSAKSDCHIAERVVSFPLTAICRGGDTDAATSLKMSFYTLLRNQEATPLWVVDRIQQVR
jgi:hypothetical protein